MAVWFQNFMAEFGMMLWEGISDTLYMTVFSTFAACILGYPIGILSVVTAPNGIHPMPVVNRIIGAIVNIGRSIPFIIILVIIKPLTRLLVGTTVGPDAVIVPLIVSATPFMARLVENSFNELDYGVIEAARAMGATDMQIIRKVMLPEAMPSLVLGISLGAITIVGCTAMAGAVGGGGLGDIAIRYGYYRSKTDVAIATVVLLVLIVQMIQSLGQYISNKIDKRKKGEK
ncbi:methionine ABC transporter permease [[Clostridium] polysaccharolyticum]|uniref:D-methionine transport system permease protein n=1 Tax=[Clostridium] polysaccharolyticum TaxID=29364 RepID=A0A1I0EKU1_9FIRM|nr:methionine ABC transporter permease [[Clostridium] polysaccharolyticum]SET45132.1 D-methionine transport system permease protein [[Clostridium] polysaccharolyticum]